MARLTANFLNFQYENYTTSGAILLTHTSVDRLFESSMPIQRHVARQFLVISAFISATSSSDISYISSLPISHPNIIWTNFLLHWSFINAASFVARIIIHDIRASRSCLSSTLTESTSHRARVMGNSNPFILRDVMSIFFNNQFKNDVPIVQSSRNIHSVRLRLNKAERWVAFSKNVE